MAWETLKNLINTNITSGLANKIRADIEHNPTLQSIVSTFGQDYIYTGLANASTTPPSDDFNRYYFVFDSSSTTISGLPIDAINTPTTIDAYKLCIVSKDGGAGNYWVTTVLLDLSVEMAVLANNSANIQTAQDDILANAANILLNVDGIVSLENDIVAHEGRADNPHTVTPAQVNASASDVSNDSTVLGATVKDGLETLNVEINAVGNSLGVHEGRVDNPHQVDIADVGGEPALGNPTEDGMTLSSTTGGVRTWENKFGNYSFDGDDLKNANLTIINFDDGESILTFDTAESINFKTADKADFTGLSILSIDSGTAKSAVTKEWVQAKTPDLGNYSFSGDDFNHVNGYIASVNGTALSINPAEEYASLTVLGDDIKFSSLEIADINASDPKSAVTKEWVQANSSGGQADFQADSTAMSIGALNAEFNSLLSKLKAAGLMAAS